MTPERTIDMAAYAALEAENARLRADMARIAALAAAGLDGRVDIVEALHTAGALANGEDVREYADAVLEFPDA